MGTRPGSGNSRIQKISFEFLPRDTSGYDLNRPGYVYLLEIPTHSDFSEGVIKVGIAGCHSTRLADFRKLGWAKVIEPLRFENGAIPVVIEATVLKWLKDLGQVSCLDPSEMHGLGGHTETFSVGDLGDIGITVDDVVNRIRQEAAKHSDTDAGVPAQVAA